MKRETVQYIGTSHTIRTNFINKYVYTPERSFFTFQLQKKTFINKLNNITISKISPMFKNQIMMDFSDGLRTKLNMHTHNMDES